MLEEKPQGSCLKFSIWWKNSCPIGFDGSTSLAKIELNSKSELLTKLQKGRRTGDDGNQIPSLCQQGLEGPTRGWEAIQLFPTPPP